MRSRFVLILAISTLVSILVSALVIAYPFMGDQALFTVFARMMSEGADLYVDVWDFKQPGIFWFVGVAGSVFGFDEIGVHTGEAIYWVAASVLIAIGLRAHMKREWVAGLFPIVGAGWYFVAAGVRELTQIEALVSPIIVGLALLLADRNDRSPSSAGIVVAGALAGAVFVFKFLAVLVPAGLVAATMIIWIRSGRGRSVLRGLILPLSLGFALVLIPFIAWVLWNDLSEVVWHVWFELPPQILGVDPRPLQRLADSTVLFLAKYAALVILAGVGLAVRGRRRSNLALLLTLSVVFGGVLVVIQLWWTYHLFILAVPIAALALLGVDALAGISSRRRIVAIVAVVAIATLPVAALGARKAERLAGLASGESLDEYRSFFTPYTDALAESTAIVISKRDPIYVLGDPLTMQIPQANQAIPINGWGPEYWTDDLWRDVADQLMTLDVPALFIRDEAAALSARRAPWFLPEIEIGYDRAVETDLGIWYTPSK